MSCSSIQHTEHSASGKAQTSNSTSTTLPLNFSFEHFNNYFFLILTKSVFIKHKCIWKKSWLWGYKTSYSTQLSMKFIMLMNVKMPTTVGILTFMSMINTISKSLKARTVFVFQFFSFYEQLKSTQLSMKKKNLTSGPDTMLFARTTVGQMVECRTYHPEVRGSNPHLKICENIPYLKFPGPFWVSTINLLVQWFSFRSSHEDLFAIYEILVSPYRGL